MSLAYTYTRYQTNTADHVYIHMLHIANIIPWRSLRHHDILYFTFFISPFSALAEASCAAVVRSAKGFVEDVGAAAAVKSRGMLELSRCSEKNAERDCHRVLAEKLKLSLPVPLSMLDTGDDLRLPVLRLRDWAQFLFDTNNSHILCGMTQPSHKMEEDILEAFWANFRKQVPDHPVFERERQGLVQLRKCYPLNLHGDEGRGRKRTAVLVMNFHSVLGRGLREKQKKRKRGGGTHRVPMLANYHGHTMTSRFLLAALPKALYTGNNEHVWNLLMNLAAEEAEFMFTTGVTDHLTGRGQFHMCVVHITGDWPWLVDSGYLLRSFRNVQKHKARAPGPGRRAPPPPVGICHLCKAGQIGWDFEQINTRNPRWLGTMFSQSLTDEWAEPSPLCRIAHPDGQMGSMWMFDTFHTWHLGVAKAFLGSFLALLSELQPGGNIDDRFASLSDAYIAWCKLHRRRRHVTRLSKELIGWPSTTQFPNGAWHKGDLSSTLMAWVQHRFENEGAAWPPMLKLAGESAKLANSFLKTLYNSEAWLTPTNARFAGSQCLDFLKNYAALAKAACEERRPLWILQPKHHALHHLAIYLLDGCSRGHVLNCLCFSTQADEDFIGRPSRLARRVTAMPGKVCQSILQRYLQSAYAHWCKDGLLVRPAAGNTT